jgi:hypothetical protein
MRKWGTALTTSRQTHARGRGLSQGIWKRGSAHAIDSSPLILSSIEEEKKSMRQRECEVFCLSLYVSALKY